MSDLQSMKVAVQGIERGQTMILERLVGAVIASQMERTE